MTRDVTPPGHAATTSPVAVRWRCAAVAVCTVAAAAAAAAANTFICSHGLLAIPRPSISTSFPVPRCPPSHHPQSLPNSIPSSPPTPPFQPLLNRNHHPSKQTRPRVPRAPLQSSLLPSPSFRNIRGICGHRCWHFPVSARQHHSLRTYVLSTHPAILSDILTPRLILILFSCFSSPLSQPPCLLPRVPLRSPLRPTPPFLNLSLHPLRPPSISMNSPLAPSAAFALVYSSRRVQNCSPSPWAASSSSFRYAPRSSPYPYAYTWIPNTISANACTAILTFRVLTPPPRVSMFPSSSISARSP